MYYCACGNSNLFKPKKRLSYVPTNNKTKHCLPH